MKKTLLVVFIHGFKGTDDTFDAFPKDLQRLTSKALPLIDVFCVQYPKYETRGDLVECVAKFKEWLQNKVIDLEVAQRTPSPTVDPSVHVILCGHSMGGIVAAETLLSIARDEPIPMAEKDGSASHNGTSSDGNTTSTSREPADAAKKRDGSSSPSAGRDFSHLLFPHVRAVMAFDTPYLGISPGVLAHGAEEQINHASKAYKAFETASTIFGFRSPSSSGASTPIADAASRGLPASTGAAAGSGGWGKWGTLAVYGGAAAAIAGAAGAAYLNRNQIMEGFAWAGSHLEFVGCLARGAELQRRVEGVVRLSASHDIGFVDFYTALDEKVTPKTKYAGAVLGDDRTFCVIPKQRNGVGSSRSPTGTKRTFESNEAPTTSKRRRSDNRDPIDTSAEDGQRVRDFAADPSKSKGLWIKCTNSGVTDEISAHRAMFTPSRNPHYEAMLGMARDRVLQWVDRGWYESSASDDSDEARKEAKEA